VFAGIREAASHTPRDRNNDQLPSPGQAGVKQSALEKAHHNLLFIQLMLHILHLNTGIAGCGCRLWTDKAIRVPCGGRVRNNYRCL
jgi:hypothetical protein